MNSFSLMTQASSALCWPPNIQIIKVDSDCMSPTLNQDDYLAVDTEQRKVREGVYVFRFGDSISVRRIHTPRAGTVSVGCDNKFYGNPLEAPIESLAEFIIGRVIFAKKRIN